jgi:hypothetical protein
VRAGFPRVGSHFYPKRHLLVGALRIFPCRSKPGDVGLNGSRQFHLDCCAGYPVPPYRKYASVEISAKQLSLRSRLIAGMLPLTGITIAISGCSGSVVLSNPGSGSGAGTPTSYTVTVTAASGGVNRSTAVTVTIPVVFLCLSHHWVACRRVNITGVADISVIMPTNDVVLSEEQRVELSSIAQSRSLPAGYVLFLRQSGSRF